LPAEGIILQLVFCPSLVLSCGWCFHQPLSLPLYSAVGVFTNRFHYRFILRLVFSPIAFTNRIKLLKIQPTTLPFIVKYYLNPFIIFGSQIKKT